MENYDILPEIIVRTPKNSFELITELYNNSKSSVLFQEALRISSLDLYQKYSQHPFLQERERERVMLSIFKYVSRMSTRCTPFGLFAGCGLGKFAEETKLRISSQYSRKTRLDMDFLCSLSRFLSNTPSLKYKLKYYSNNSLYEIGTEYRFIYYQNINNRKEFQISSVNKTSYLKNILGLAANGCYIDELLNTLSQLCISKEEVLNYIDDLIESQILISELEPNVSGCDYFERIISVIERTDIHFQHLHELKSIKSLINHIDSSSSSPIEAYKKIENTIDQIGIPYDKNRLFQVDTINIFDDNRISFRIQDELKSSIRFLNKICNKGENENLIKFKQEFEKRFESEEIPLTLALDPETGIEYPVSNIQKDTSNLLLDGFRCCPNSNFNWKKEFNKIQLFILDKILNKEIQDNEIILKDSDTKELQEDWNNFPDSFSAFFCIINDKNKKTNLFLRFAGNTSAGNLLTRFAHADEKINSLVKRIASHEKELHSKAILAEVTHLPNDRMGNVMSQPQIRTNEISLLCHSNLNKNDIIPISDIMISIKNGRITLRSKKKDKLIIPYITNSYNYTSSTIPIYRFLGDLQKQGKQVALELNVEKLLEILPSIPRIRYKSTILSLATWKIEVKEIKHWLEIIDDTELKELTNQWRKDKMIPLHSLLADYDNELFIDWNNIISIRAFLSTIKTRKDFLIKEFLFVDRDLIIKDEKGLGYLNECIVSFQKKI